MLMRVIVLFLLCWIAPAAAFAVHYHLDINYENVTITGEAVKKFTVNGSIPAPTLIFTEGDEATITVTNHTAKETSIHWHGLLVPAMMDGVPNLNGFDGIQAGETFIYHFPIRQAGTYWYHAHSMGQEQDGLYGALIIKPKQAEVIPSDRDYTILLSDFSQESSEDILAHLKMDAGYYNRHQRTLGDFFADVQRKGFSAAWQSARDWAAMRMTPTDLSDVSGYHFLLNGKTPAQNWTGLFKRGEKIRLRFINASAMTFHDLRIPNLKMQVVAADGQNIEPVTVDEIRIAPAETYDVIVTPPEEKAYSIVAEPIDRTGFAMGTLAPQQGMKGEMPRHRKRSLLTMADMGMEMDMHMHHMTDDEMAQMDRSDMESGWADADTPEGNRALQYEDLRTLGIQPKASPPTRELTINLGGNMERYLWTLNGKTFDESTPFVLQKGERVRLTFVNQTMMAHPMHLHGMFVQLENGQPLNKLPNKHTIFIPPAASRSVLLTADESGEWPIHCHLFFHMMSGMMNTVIVSDAGEKNEVSQPSKKRHARIGGHPKITSKQESSTPLKKEGSHHVHH
jgi:FtsP/CotA-like multicopper oxidase with cupredoxin domain